MGQNCHHPPAPGTGFLSVGAVAFLRGSELQFSLRRLCPRAVIHLRAELRVPNVTGDNGPKNSPEGQGSSALPRSACSLGGGSVRCWRGSSFRAAAPFLWTPRKAIFLSSKHGQEEFPASQACLVVNLCFLDVQREIPLAGFQLLPPLGAAANPPNPACPIHLLHVASELTSPPGCPGTHQPGASVFLKSLRLTRVTVCLIQLACLGVAEDTFYRTANSGRFDDRQWKKWISQRAFVALYVASHRGHSEAVQYLLEHGKSHSGWVCSHGWCSVTKSCLTLCNLMDCSMPGFPVLHHLPESTQTHVH